MHFTKTFPSFFRKKYQLSILLHLTNARRCDIVYTTLEEWSCNIKTKPSAPSEYSDQPEHLCSLSESSLGAFWTAENAKFFSCGQWRLIRLCNCWGWFVSMSAHMSEGTFGGGSLTWEAISSMTLPRFLKYINTSYFCIFCSYFTGEVMITWLLDQRLLCAIQKETSDTCRFTLIPTSSSLEMACVLWVFFFFPENRDKTEVGAEIAGNLKFSIPCLY